MPTLTYPGVYVQEISSGVRPITIASTSTAAFVGLAQMGPSQPTLVTSWTQFQLYYGTFISDGFLAHSVLQFFNNGGQKCYIVRVTRSDAATASVTVQNRASAPTAGVTFSAQNQGVWGNTLYLQIENGTANPGNSFKISVRQQTDPAVIPANFQNITALEAFDNLTVDPTDPNFFVTILQQNSHLIAGQMLATNVALQRGVQTGGFNPLLPLGTNNSLQISLDNDGFQQITLPATASASTTLTDISTAIQTLVIALTAKKTSTSGTAFTGFTCTVDTSAGQPRLVLQSGTITATSSVAVQAGSPNDATALLKLGTGNGAYSQGGLALRLPALATVVQIGDNAVTAPVTAVTPGSNGSAALNELSFSNVFPLLDNVTDFSLLAVPGEGTTVMADLGMSYCSNRPLQDVFYIADVDSTDDTPAEAITFRNKLTTATSYGAVYFPWVQALDPTGVSAQPILVPASGYIAGLYARTDGSRGVWKAPAGTAASLNGVVGLSAVLSDVQHGTLNPIGINVIRQFAGSGIVSFGARTITSDSEWLYVPVRRTAILLRVSIYYGIQWAVFEPNDEPLWSQLRLNVGSMMTTLFRQGAFQGSTPSQAFFVKCDSETTTQADINSGVVNLLVGFAPLRPAEFVVVQISQQAGQASS
jgi:phage tail sheath protein FI